MRAIRRARGHDVRCSYEKVHDAVLERVKGTADECEYLQALFTFDPAEGRDGYLARAEPFLEERERAMLVPLRPLLFTSDICKQCGEHRWEIDEPRGERVCVCGVVEVCATVSTKYLPYDRARPVHHTYRRITHFTSVLDALSTRYPPAELLTCVQAEMRRQRVDAQRLTHSRLREIMRAARMETYYPLAPTLLAHLKGTPLPRLSAGEIRTLHAMFVDVQHAFEAVIPYVDKTRRNFVSYPFLLRMCLLRIGRDDLAKHLILLKTPEKQRKQQTIWHAIAKYMQW